MTLVVARRFPDCIVVVADTHIIDPAMTRTSPTEGVVKSILVAPGLLVSFAGNLHFAELALRSFEPASAAARHFLEFHRQSHEQTDFIVCRTPEHEVAVIKNGEARVTDAAWLGTHTSFQRFQRYMADPPVPGAPENTARTSVLQLPNEVDQSSVEQYARMCSAMKAVIDDPAEPSVGGFLVPVAASAGEFEYLDYADILTHPMKFDQMPSGTAIPFGTAQEGGYTFNFLGAGNTVALYFVQGEFGVVFSLPEAGLMQPALVRATPLDFEDAARARTGVEIRTMFTRVEEAVARAHRTRSTGDLEAALGYARYAAERWPKSSQAYAVLGLVQALLDRLDEAVQTLDRAIELDPRDGRVRFNRGAALLRMGRRDDALDGFTGAITAVPRYVDALRARAKVLRLLDRSDEAQRDDDEAQRLIAEGRGL